VNQDRELDVVVFGATGFTGRLVAGYLAAHAPAGVRVGLAGRSEKRLADVRSQLPAAACPLLAAGSADLADGSRSARYPGTGAPLVCGNKTQCDGVGPNRQACHQETPDLPRSRPLPVSVAERIGARFLAVQAVGA